MSESAGGSRFLSEEDGMLEADAKTFTVLQDGYAKDRQHLYLRGSVVEEEIEKNREC